MQEKANGNHASNLPRLMLPCSDVQEKGNNNAQWWQHQVLSTLGSDRWMRVGLRQLSGMLVMVFALSSLSVRPLCQGPPHMTIQRIFGLRLLFLIPALSACEFLIWLC